MASNPPAECCTVGFKHDGEPTGSFETIGGVETYVAHPAASPSGTTTALLLLTDVLGHRFANAQLLADQLAEAGYSTYMPDLFHGDPVPLQRDASFDIQAWLRNGHDVAATDPVVERVIGALRGERGVRRLGALGYCFGAKYVVRFMRERGGVDVGYMAHPSFVDEEELTAIVGPLSIAAAQTDRIFPREKRVRTEELLEGLGEKVTWQIVLYSGVEHGFAVRADVSKKHARWAREQAFHQAVAWFRGFLDDGGQ